MLRQIQEMALHAGKQSMPVPWVMIRDVEGRLDGRQVTWEGFGNHVVIESPWSIAAGDEESYNLQHNLLLLFYDPGVILRHPQCKKILSISHESKK